MLCIHSFSHSECYMLTLFLEHSPAFSLSLPVTENIAFLLFMLLDDVYWWLGDEGAWQDHEMFWRAYPNHCRSGNVTKSVAKPHDRNLFLQSLSEEEQNTSADQSKAKKSVEDKDLVESLENGVKFWTDYSKVQYHPQSLYELYGSWTDFDKFNNYGTAREVVSEWSQMEELNERLRFFVEECDHIQVPSFFTANYQ